jgi:hypothetical protein
MNNYPKFCNKYLKKLNRIVIAYVNSVFITTGMCKSVNYVNFS